MKWGFTIGCVLMVTLVASVAEADEARIAVHTEGFWSARVRREIIESLPDGIDVISDTKFKKAMAQEGLPIPLGVAVTQPGDARDKVLKGVGDAADESDLDGAIIGRTRASGGSVRLTLIFVQPGGAKDPVVDETVSLSFGSNSTLIGDTLTPAWLELDLVGDGKAEEEPEEEESDDEPEEEEEPEEPEDDGEGLHEPHVVGREYLDQQAVLVLASRFFDYTDRDTDNLRGYNIAATPMIQVGARLFPFTNTGQGFFEDLGFTGSFARALFISSETAGGDDVDTAWEQWGLGLFYRIRLDDDPGPVPVLGIDVGLQRYRMEFFTQDAVVAAEAPSVDYTALHAGLEGQIPAGPVRIVLAGRYIGPLSSGEVYDRFSRASIVAFAVDGGVAIPVTDAIDVRLLGAYQHFIYSFDPDNDDTFRAAGAADQYLLFKAGVGFVY